MRHLSLVPSVGHSILALCLAFGAAHAETPLPSPLPQPMGEVILRVGGAILVKNNGDEAAFDMAMLQSLGVFTITTTTLWTDGEQRFTGVPLRAVLDRVGAMGTKIDAQALNDYRADIPISDVQKEGPILAYAQNGVPLSVRDMGPLWVIYPYDSSVAFQNELIYARSVWQLQRIVVQP